MLRGNVKPGDAEIIRFLAELAVTLPPLLAACPEFRDCTDHEGGVIGD